MSLIDGAGHAGEVGGAYQVSFHHDVLRYLQENACVEMLALITLRNKVYHLSDFSYIHEHTRS